MESLIIDIQRSSIHDGPGIRTTVFLKGCPLKCAWCHNPESQSFKEELSFNQSLCSSCGLCVKSCKQGVHTIQDGVHRVDYSKCISCGSCVKDCPENALTLVGDKISPQEIFEIVKKDEVFYAQGNGGLTISGGEALSHPRFCIELLKLCKERGIHTCIETSGFASAHTVSKVAPYVDLFLFDFKVSNDEDAREYIGASLKQIQENFDYLYKQENQIILRCPIIPSINDTKEHFDQIGAMSVKYPKLVGIELLPYHNFGVSKGKNIGIQSQSFRLPTETEKKDWLNYFRKKGYNKVSLS